MFLYLPIILERFPLPLQRPLSSVINENSLLRPGDREGIYFKRSMNNILVSVLILSTEMHVVGRYRNERKTRPR